MGFKRFTKDEIEFLRENYPSKGVEYCANILNRNNRTIIDKASKLKIKTKRLSKKKELVKTPVKQIKVKPPKKEKQKVFREKQTPEERKEKNRQFIKQWYEKNKERINEERKLKRLTIGEEERNRHKQYMKEYHKKNKEILKQKHKARLEKDAFFKLKADIRNLIGINFRRKGFKKGSKTELILGCSFEELKIHLESMFEPWMNWSNKGNPKDGVLNENKTWDIDHIIPLSTAKTKEDIIKLNHYTNLKPLCSFKNRITKRANLF